MEDYTRDITRLLNDAVDKAKEIGQGAKLRALITAEEAKIREQYYQLGKKYYRLYNDTPETELLDYVDKIKASREKIDAFKAELNNEGSAEYKDVVFEDVD